MGLFNIDPVQSKNLGTISRCCTIASVHTVALLDAMEFLVQLSLRSNAVRHGAKGSIMLHSLQCCSEVCLSQQRNVSSSLKT